jgi:hypothetical protein
MSDPPAGSDWLLVELLAECSDSACAPVTSILEVIGSSGQSYPPAPSFQISPLFATENLVGNQVWGYLGFLIPRSELQVTLALVQPETTYYFALQ